MAEGGVGTVPAAARFLDRFRASWRRAGVARAFVTGVTALLGAWVVLVALDLAAPLPSPARGVLRLLPFLVAAGVAALLVRRFVPAPSPMRLALRAEEEIPALEQLLTTALAPGPGGLVGELFRARAQARLSGMESVARVPLGIGRKLAGAGAAAAALVLLVMVGGPREVWERWIRLSDAEAAVAEWTRSPGDPLPPGAFGSLLVEGVEWTVIPPAYSGLPPDEVRDAATLSALPGSRIRVRAALPPAGVALVARVVVGGGSPDVELAEEASPDGWAAEWVVESGHRGLNLELVGEGEVAARRVIPLLVREDGAPEVRLLLPDEDLVVATPRGAVPLRATARDDLGLRRFALTWIHTSGSGESFSFRQGEWAWDAVSERDGGLVGEGVLELADMELQPGDVLHLRAVATDGNDVTGPGEGVSATRVIRVARPGEEAEVTTLIGFPLEGEKDPVLSQRMIILMTEELRDRGHPPASSPLMSESARIAGEQGRLRDVVGEEIYVRLAAEEDPAAADPFAPGGHLHDHAPAGAGPRPGQPDTAGIRVIPGGEAALERALQLARTLEEASLATGTGDPREEMHLHDASPILSINPVKLLAFNAMWAAERELRQGALEAALVHQYRALGLIQEMREENRVFARGRQQVAPIDVAGVRGTGRMRDVAPLSREAAPPVPGVEGILAELEAAMVGLAGRAPGTASLELGGVALRLLGQAGVDPSASALVAEAATAAGRGEMDRAAALLLRARAALAPTAAGGTGPPVPTATSPVSAEYFRRLRGGGP
jgi:hypothetical protein